MCGGVHNDHCLLGPGQVSAAVSRGRCGPSCSGDGRDCLFMKTQVRGRSVQNCAKRGRVLDLSHHARLCGLAAAALRREPRICTVALGSGHQCLGNPGRPTRKRNCCCGRPPAMGPHLIQVGGGLLRVKEARVTVEGKEPALMHSAVAECSHDVQGAAFVAAWAGSSMTGWLSFSGRVENLPLMGGGNSPCMCAQSWPKDERYRTRPNRLPLGVAGGARRGPLFARGCRKLPRIR